MSRVLRIASTSIGMKLLMALSGLILFGFVVGHLAGNLKMFSGAEDMNSYAETLRQHPGLLWPVRLLLLGSFLLHVTTGARLWLRNRASRLRGVQGYKRETTLRASFAARYMIVSGLLLLAFIAFHLLHFTFRAFATEQSLAVDSLGRHDVYLMVYSAFQNPLLTGLYVLALSMLGLHLWHGVPSTPQTLGVSHSAYDRLVHRGLRVIAVLLVLGFIAIPIGIFFGLVPSAG